MVGIIEEFEQMKVQPESQNNLLHRPLYTFGHQPHLQALNLKIWNKVNSSHLIDNMLSQWSCGGRKKGEVVWGGGCNLFWRLGGEVSWICEKLGQMVGS